MMASNQVFSGLMVPAACLEHFTSYQCMVKTGENIYFKIKYSYNIFFFDNLTFK